MNDIEIGRAAREMQTLHGKDALSESVKLADKAWKDGDFEGYSDWKRIAQAVEELERQEPGAGS